MRTVTLIALALTLPASAQAAAFSFNVLIRAGLAGAGDWEVGMGLNAAGTPTVSGHMSPYYLNGLPQRFEIGYTASTGTAYTRIYAGTTVASGLRLNLNYTVPGAAAFDGVWELPSFYTASRVAGSSATVQNMSLVGLNTISPLSLTASGTQTTNQALIAFAPAANGDWQLSGELIFTGLRAYPPGTAARSQLQFALTAEANPTPEPTTLLSTGLALAALGLAGSRRLTGSRSHPSSGRLKT